MSAYMSARRSEALYDIDLSMRGPDLQDLSDGRCRCPDCGTDECCSVEDGIDADHAEHGCPRDPYENGADG